jgi:hypothetical protein
MQKEGVILNITCVIVPDFPLPKISNTPDGILRIHTLLTLGGYESELLDLRECKNMEEFIDKIRDVESEYIFIMLSTNVFVDLPLA